MDKKKEVKIEDTSKNDTGKNEEVELEVGLVNKNKIAELLENKSVKIALGVSAVVLIVVSVLIVLNFVKKDDKGNDSNKSTSKSSQSKKSDNENAVKREPKIDIKEELLADDTLGFSSKDIFNPASLQSTVTTGYTSISSVGISTISTNTTSENSVPNITGISPSNAQSGSSVTVSGNNFASDGKLVFADKEATVTSWSSNTIIAKVPSGLIIGKVTVSVEVNGQKSNLVEYSVKAPPESVSLTLIKIYTSSGKKYAQITVKEVSVVENEVVTVSGTNNYTEGQSIGGNFKIININSSSIVLLYGDERIELDVGETVKKNL